MEIIQNGLLNYLPNTIVIMLIGYLVIKVLDFATGLLKAWKNGDGLIRWIAELIAIVFVILIDILLGLDFYICGLTLALFVYKEAGSIIENLGQLGVDLPLILKDKLEVLNQDKKSK